MLITLLTTISKVPKTAMSLKQLEQATKIVVGDTKGIKVSILLTQQLIHSYERGTGTGGRNKFARNMKYTRCHLISPRPFQRTILLSLVSSHYICERGRGGRSSQKFRVRQCSRILSPSNSKLRAEELLCHALKPTYFGCACGGRPAIGEMCHTCGGCEKKSCQENAASLEEEEAVGKGW